MKYSFIQLYSREEGNERHYSYDTDFLGGWPVHWILGIKRAIPIHDIGIFWRESILRIVTIFYVCGEAIVIGLFFHVCIDFMFPHLGLGGIRQRVSQPSDC